MSIYSFLTNPALSAYNKKDSRTKFHTMSMSQLKICVLGCGGFIGSHLVERILSTTNWLVLGIDRDESKIRPPLSDPRFLFSKGDIDSCRDTADFIEKSDIVVSLAALCNPSLYNTIPLEVIQSNFVRPLSIVEKCSQLKKHLVHFSTCEVYGKTVSAAAQQPFDPNTDVFIEDATPLVLGPVHAQRWSYACAKQLLERAIYAHGIEHGLPYSIIRPFNFIGPRMDFIPGIDGDGVPRVLACFMDALLNGTTLKLVNGGKNYRCFTYIDDAIDALMAILSNPHIANRHIFNIGNPDNEITIKDLAHLMIRVYGELRPDCAGGPSLIEQVTGQDFYGPGYEDSDRRIPDITKAKTLLNWNPETPLADALKTTMAFYIKEYGGLILKREAI